MAIGENKYNIVQVLMYIIKYYMLLNSNNNDTYFLFHGDIDLTMCTKSTLFLILEKKMRIYTGRKL